MTAVVPPIAATEMPPPPGMMAKTFFRIIGESENRTVVRFAVRRGEGSCAGPDSDVDLLLDLTAEGPGSRLSRLSGIRLELEELLNIPVGVACEELLKDRVSQSARSQAIGL